ncbi:MAG: CPBP family intramembrane metalloprotease, partial [Leptospiraceae bacterium]|nr:CPBP family intramembrane metalloprotease [Leptospiraceae bacterium]
MKLAYRYGIALGYGILSFALATLFQWLLIQSGWLPVTEAGLQLSQLNSLHFFAMILCQAGGFLLMAFVFLTFRWLDCFDFEWNVSFKTLAISFGLLLLINAGVSLVFHFAGAQVDQYADLNKDVLRQRPVAFIVTVALIAPLYEEFVFRGILLRSLIRENAGFWEIGGGVIFSAVIFSLLHLETATSTLVLLPIFVLAIFFSTLMLRTRNL